MFGLDLTQLFLYVILVAFALLFLVWGAVALERRVRWYLRGLWSRDGIDKQEIRAGWKKISEMMQSKNVYEQRQALIKADNLFDTVLQAKLMPGPDMGRRLKFFCHAHPEIRFVWRAHHLRNTIVHEHDVVIRSEDLRQAIRQYHKAFRMLGLL